MSSGVTFSGFNSIDFNVVLNAIMQQESQPLTALQSRQSSLQTRVKNFDTLSTRVNALQTAAEALQSTDAAAAFKATTSDGTAVGVSAGASAVAGRYDVVVSELARAQVTASSGTAPDSDTTVIADGGTFTIGSETITISGSVTLKGLADAINADADAPARAAVVQSGTNQYKLVLTGKSTGAANAFTIDNQLTGGTGLAFTDTDLDGVSGDSAADNAVQATDASVTINNVAITSASNTLDAAIPGVSVTLYKKDPAATIVVDVTADTSVLKTKLQSFVTAYNDLVKFANDQNTSAGKGDQASIGRDPVLRGLRARLRQAVATKYDTGGAFQYLSQIGVEVTQAGTLQINDSVYNEAIKNGTADITTLLAGDEATPGAFAALTTLFTEYTEADGYLKTAQSSLSSQIARLSDQIDNMSDRLAIRRLALQQEFTAADAAMSQLKNQSASLGGLSF